MLAGHETTANTLAWVGMLLAQQPTVEARLLAEWGQVLGGRSPTVADIPQLTYTQQVIKETLRLYPPVAVMARSANQDYDLEGVRIPAGCVTLFSQWVMHRSDRYFEEPAQFNPDRWTPEFEKTLPKGAYFPFGEGPRICIGKGFAQMEAALILATLGQEYHLSLVPDQAIALFPSITLRPKDGIQVQVQRR
jgi:cytochrome P450